MAEAARPQLLQPDEVHDTYLPDLSDKLVLLDVRTPLEWMMDGYIAGATRIPVADMNERLFSEVTPDAQVIVYCAHGIRSAAVANAMLQAGYEQVFDLAGGIDRWIRAGLPVVRDNTM